MKINGILLHSIEIRHIPFFQCFFKVEMKIVLKRNSSFKLLHWNRIEEE